MKWSPFERSGLVRFIDRSIEENGQCTLRDTHLLDFLWSSRSTCEGKLRRLRHFAHQHNWAVASHAGRTAIFTSMYKGPHHGHFAGAGHRHPHHHHPHSGSHAA